MHNHKGTEQFPKPLQKVFDKYEVQDQFTKAVSEHAYNAGVKNAWGESTAIPALLEKTNQPVHLEFPKLDTYWFDEFAQGETPSYTLSQPDVNYIRPFLSDLASVYQSTMQGLRYEEANFYFLSEEGTESGLKAFAELNSVRNDIRKLKRHQNRLNAIIKVLKYGNK